MTDPAQAKRLAQTLVDVANRCGLRASALITDMEQPLAPVVGNGLEIELCLDYLQGRTRPQRLHSVTLALGVELLISSGMSSGASEAEAHLQRALDSGAAAERLARSVAALGGPRDVFAWRDTIHERAPARRVLTAATAGCVERLHARRFGEIAVDLGAGRRRPDQPIDPWVGLRLRVACGDRVDAGQPLVEVHARDESSADRALTALGEAVTLGGSASLTAVVIDRIDGARHGETPRCDGVAA